MSTQLPLVARVVPTQSRAPSQTNRHWFGVMYEGCRTDVLDDSPASQWTLYVEPPSRSMSSPSHAGQVTLPTSHVGLGGAGKYSSAGVVNAIGTIVIVDCTVTVVMGREPDWLVSCA